MLDDVDFPEIPAPPEGLRRLRHAADERVFAEGLHGGTETSAQGRQRLEARPQERDRCAVALRPEERVEVERRDVDRLRLGRKETGRG